MFDIHDGGDNGENENEDEPPTFPEPDEHRDGSFPGEEKRDDKGGDEDS